MDCIAWVPHAIWAFVALCAIGTGVYWNYLGRVRYTVATAVNKLSVASSAQEQVVVALAKEVETIRAGLEKLKAIPPKPPRF